MRIAFFGDVVGRPGRRAVERFAPEIRKDYGIDLMIANVENAAGGTGITERAIKELRSSGIDFLTTGNHIWDKKEGVSLLDDLSYVIRPANYPMGAPGRGFNFINVGDISVAIMNLQGRVFMPSIDCPFRVAGKYLEEIRKKSRVVIVDFHGEATSEKIAMAWYLDGKVSLIVGTHTHVPTKDFRILPGGTGYITDVGMTGSYDSVIGVEKGAVIERFLSMRPARFVVAKDDVRSDILIAEISEADGRAANLQHIQVTMES